MKYTKPDSDAIALRKKALELFRIRTSENKAKLTIADTLKLIHELEVHQIELELQNEELVNARAEAMEAVDRATKLYDFAPVGYFTLSKDGNIREVNLQGAKLLGKERTYIINSQFRLFISNGYEKTFNQFLEKVFDSKIEETCEIEISNVKDRGFYTHLSGVIADDEEYCFLTVTDITTEKKAAMLLEATNLQKNLILEAAGEGILGLDKSGKHSFANSSAIRQLGYKESELQTVNFHGLIHHHNKDGNPYSIEDCPIQKVLLTGEPSNGEEFFWRKDGTGFPCEYSCLPIYKDQKITGAVITFRNISDHKQALQSLRDSEEKYRTIFENVQDVFYQTDISGIILEVSPSIKYFSGFNRQELIGSQVSDIYYNPEEREILLNLIRTKGELKDYEIRLKSKDGEIIYTSINARLIFDNEGKPHHIDGALRDISDRKKNELELRENELQYRTLANAGFALIWKSGTDKLCNYFNEPWLKFTGRTLEQETGNGWAEGVHPEDLENCLSIFNGAFDKQESFDMEYRLKKANGDYAWIKNMATPNFNSEGVFIGYIGHCFDVSKRKRSEIVQLILYNIALSVVKLTSCEQLLKVIQHELNQILDTTNFFVALYNPETEKLRKLHWADTKDDFTEWDARNSLSGHVVKSGKTMLLKRNEIEQFSKNNILTLLGTPAECWLGVPIKSDKETIGVMVIQSYEDKNAYDEESSTILELVANNLSIFLNKLNTYSDLNIAKEKAEESDRLKSAFLANMSHEIRTPMNGILGFTQLLKEPQLTGDERIEYIGLIEKSGDRMLNIINDIVDISKIEAGLMTVHYSETNINDQVKFLFHFFTPEVEEKNIHFSYNTSLTDEESLIMTDREKVYSVLTNLIKNAIKFTNEGSIEIGYTKKSDFLEFTVKDSGTGIPLEKQNIIFERFRQGSELPTRNYEGAGLGLSISKAFVEMLGGKIWLESVEGKGSEFFFTIPYKVPEKHIALTESVTTEDQRKQLLKNLKILIADDDNVSIMLLSLMLDDFCDKILVAKTGTEAVEMVRNNHDLDLILMDIKMPEMDGYEATKIIRQFNSSIIIIAQTAYGMSNDREKALTAGCNDHISKPIDKTLILKKITNLVFKQGDKK